VGVLGGEDFRGKKFAKYPGASGAAWRRGFQGGNSLGSPGPVGVLGSEVVGEGQWGCLAAKFSGRASGGAWRQSFRGEPVGVLGGEAFGECQWGFSAAKFSGRASGVLGGEVFGESQ